MALSKTLGDRLLQVRKILKISQMEVSKALAISQSNYSQYEKNTVLPNYQFIANFSKQYGVHYMYLLEGEGSIFKGEIDNKKYGIETKPCGTPEAEERRQKSNSFLTNIQAEMEKLRAQKEREKLAREGAPPPVYLPVEGDVSAGRALVDKDKKLSALTVSGYLLERRSGYGCYRINGDNMMPEYRNGDYIVVDQEYQQDDIYNNKVLVVRHGDVITLKKAVFAPNTNNTILLSLNLDDQPVLLDNTYIIIGIVTLLIRSF